MEKLIHLNLADQSFKFLIQDFVQIMFNYSIDNYKWDALLFLETVGSSWNMKKTNVLEFKCNVKTHLFEASWIGSMISISIVTL